MSKPLINANRPARVDLNKGREYFFCVCGRSATQPFCDGSHAGSGFQPLAFLAAQDGVYFLCRCKHTVTPPYCDGSHKQFPDALTGQEGPGED